MFCECTHTFLSHEKDTGPCKVRGCDCKAFEQRQFHGSHRERPFREEDDLPFEEVERHAVIHVYR